MSLFAVRPLVSCLKSCNSSFKGVASCRNSGLSLSVTRAFSKATVLAARTKKEVEAEAAKKSVGGTEKDKRLSALEAAVKQIAQQYGKGSIMKLKGQTATFQSSDVIPTGSIGLDAALGIGGLPKGRVVEIYGPEASGKTTLALHVIAEAQKKGGNCVFIDVEHALNIEFAKKLGVNVDELYISQPDNAEQALETADTLVRSGGADVIVVDSVAALVPRAEVEGEMGDQHMALQARLMSQALRKLTHNLSTHKCLLIFINQIRMKVGVMFGNPEVTAGGNALKFYSSVRLDVRKSSPVKDGDNIVGNRVRVKVVKNKAAAPFQQAEFDIIFGEGISRGSELVELGASCGVLTKQGAWYSYGEQQLGQGKEKTKKYLEEHPELAATVENAIKEKLAAREPVVGAGDEAAAEAEEGPAGLEKEPSS